MLFGNKKVPQFIYFVVQCNYKQFKYGDRLMNSLARYENNGIELLINTETNEFILTYNKKYHDRKLSCIKEEQY